MKTKTSCSMGYLALSMIHEIFLASGPHLLDPTQCKPAKPLAITVEYLLS